MRREEQAAAGHARHPSPYGYFSVAFKRPSGAAYERYISTLASDKGKLIQAARAFALDVVVSPEAAEFSAILEKFPGIVSKIAGNAASIASASEADDAKKL
jgi:hypothetical protein